MITFGGFLKGEDERQKIEGTCRPADFGNALTCDVYNGLPKWRVTELVIRITWAPYSNSDVRDFRERVSIAPLTTVAVSFRLGTQLPVTRWSWLVVAAKGVELEQR